MSYNEKTGVYSCQLDEQWFDLRADQQKGYSDHSYLIWEEFTQRNPDFLTQSTTNQSEEPNKKATPLASLNGRFSKVNKSITCKEITTSIRRPDSAVITLEIHSNILYYPNISENGLLRYKKTPRESASVQPATKRATPKKPTTTTPVKQSKPAPPPTKKPSKRKLPQKVRKRKADFQLVDEDDEDHKKLFPLEK
ncbi:hypothetical protein Tco_0687638 [Tanacetum coccineum]